ncbi:MAG: CBS domain-containing protein [Phycisphaerales bacterium]|nr:CBS domain-containing protein [Planctomycetota bacterium]MCZ6492552.1 CBS domain-containing protein [Planctomycetota bacterium]MCZ6542597.1 CBS domain-containing protein [Planctomycetota bacterium]MCZ6611824.1 CBS domain-containing protein [Planctomycetota bacterium]MCZ6736014.1 CBS domain-containing protein [Planctomycetota bacterium]
MATAEQLTAIKGGTIASLPPQATVLEAAQLMNDRHIGSVLVTEGNQLVGIFTERDVMRRVVADQRDPATTTVADVMTSPVACAAPHTTLDEIRTVMRDKRIRHVPVVNGGGVLGMISLGDLNKAEHDGQVETIRYLEQYMSVA